MTKDEGHGLRRCSLEPDALAYCAGALAEPDRERVERHVVECDECRAAVAAFALTAMDETPEEKRMLVEVADRAAGAALALVPGSERAVRPEAAGPALAHGRAAREARPAPFRVRWRAPLLAAAALVAALAGFWLWSAGGPGSTPGRGAELLRAATREARPTELRLSGSDYAPFQPTRGAARGERADRLAEARALLLAEVAERPDPEARRLLAQALLASGDDAAAVAQLEAARAEAPGNNALEIDLAVALATGGRDERALELLDGVLARDPQSAEALFNRAIIRERLGDMTGSREDFRLYLQIDPTSRWAEEARGRLSPSRMGPS